MTLYTRHVPRNSQAQTDRNHCNNHLKLIIDTLLQYFESIPFIYCCLVIKVRVDLAETEDVCSAASKRGRYRQEVKVGATTTRSVPFVIIPMKEGQRSIEVKAAVKDSSLNDGISKTLLVVVS